MELLKPVADNTDSAEILLFLTTFAERKTWPMNGPEVIVLVGVLLVASGALAPRIHLPAPVVWLLAGVAVGFIPGVDHVELPPEAVLLVFLPAILYWESLTTSLREIRANLRVITLLAVSLVIAPWPGGCHGGASPRCAPRA
jgi:hypothetical protein